ncbi:APC family permease, partial [Candidatus Woesearchaeota archaeon]|nr:APC family permease [Candidatus Woesearchaeota archaeon]
METSHSSIEKHHDEKEGREPQGAKLQRGISYPILFFLIINSILGTGVFFTPSITARIAGPWMIIAWIAIGLISILLASMFGELVERMPSAGGMYEYTKQAFGIFPSFIVGWLAILASNITISMLIVGAIKYLNPSLPSIFTIIFGLIIIWGFAFIASLGLKTSIFTLLAFALITFGSIAISAILGLEHINPVNLDFSNFPGMLPLMLAIFIAADTFFGWESATYLSEEVKNPRKTIPRAFRHATILIVIIVLILVFGLLASMGVSQLGISNTPIFDLFNNFLGSRYAFIASLLIYLAIIGSVADWVVSSPRLLLAMARDKEMIAQLAEIHPKRRVPQKAIIFQAVLSSVVLLIGVGTYRVILETLLPLTFLLYAFLGIVLLRIRKKQEYKPKYPVYLGKLGIILIIFLNISLIIAWFITSPYSM